MAAAAPLSGREEELMTDWRLTRIPLTTLASGAEVGLVLHELAGRGDGPTLGISAAIHGDEAVGVEILYQLRQALDPGPLRGRVVMLPCANPLAYQAGTRNTPLDMTNLNRVFPGDPAGWFTEQLADLITRRFLLAWTPTSTSTPGAPTPRWTTSTSSPTSGCPGASAPATSTGRPSPSRDRDRGRRRARPAGHGRGAGRG